MALVEALKKHAGLGLTTLGVVTLGLTANPTHEYVEVHPNVIDRTENYALLKDKDQLVGIYTTRVDQLKDHEVLKLWGLKWDGLKEIQENDWRYVIRKVGKNIIVVQNGKAGSRQDIISGIGYVAERCSVKDLPKRIDSLGPYLLQVLDEGCIPALAKSQ